MLRTLARGVAVVAWGLLYVGCGGSEPPVPRTLTGTRTQTFWSSGGKTVRPAGDETPKPELSACGRSRV